MNVIYTNKEYNFDKFMRKVQDNVRRLLTVEEISNLRQYYAQAVDPEKDGADRMKLHMMYVQEYLLENRKGRQIFTDYKTTEPTPEDYAYNFAEFNS